MSVLLAVWRPGGVTRGRPSSAARVRIRAILSSGKNVELSSEAPTSQQPAASLRHSRRFLLFFGARGVQFSALNPILRGSVWLLRRERTSPRPG